MKRSRQQATAAGSVVPTVKPVKFSFGPSLLDIECGACGTSNDWQRWTVDKLGGTREAGTFQCPRCSYAFRVVKTGQGFANKIEEIQATL